MSEAGTYPTCCIYCGAQADEPCIGWNGEEMAARHKPLAVLMAQASA